MSKKSVKPLNFFLRKLDSFNFLRNDNRKHLPNQFCYMNLCFYCCIKSTRNPTFLEKNLITLQTFFFFFTVNYLYYTINTASYSEKDKSFSSSKNRIGYSIQHY